MAIPAPRPGAAALVTGASSGIGAELARGLSERGHDTILVARRAERLEALAAELRERDGRHVEVLPCDVADADARERLYEQLGALGLELDVLVLCAGFGMGGPFLEQDPGRIRQMARTNVEAVMAMSRELLPDMAARRSGAVMVVSSFAGGQPMPYFGAYAATKAAATSFSQMLGEEMRPYGITVTALCPGGVHTEFADIADMESQAEKQPGAFMAQADDIARAGLAGLERGKRVVMPGAGVKAFSLFARNAPRALWLRLCRRMMS